VNFVLVRLISLRWVCVCVEQNTKAIIQENAITHLNKNYTDFYQKQIQQALQECDALIEKGKHRYLMNIRPTAPNINAYIKHTRKTNLFVL